MLDTECFRPLRLHARGRYTSIYSGVVTSSGEDCAIKVLTSAPQRLWDQLVQRLRNEAVVLSQFSHPNILRCYHDGSSESLPYIVVEWIGGGSLSALLQDTGQPLTPRQTASLGIALLAALQELHQRDIVHRDIKPANILLRSASTPEDAVLCDFGIAQLPQDRLTAVDTAMGSLHFMAPEQRVDARSAGPAADLYAIGGTLYQAITGWNPYNLFMTRESSPRWEVVPAPLRQILFTATRRDPQDRFPDSAAMAQALREALPVMPEHPVAPRFEGADLDVPTTLPAGPASGTED